MKKTGIEMDYSKQITYYTAGNIVTLFCQWLIVMIIPKIADFSEAGVFAVAVSISSVLNPIATFVLSQHQVADQYASYCENDYAVVRAITTLVSFLCIIPISLIFGYDYNQILVIIAYTLYRNLINYVSLHISTLQINGHLDYVGKCMIVEGIVSFIIFIITYIASSNIMIATLSMAIIGGGCFFFLISKGYEHYEGHKYGLKIDFKQTVPLLLVGGPLLLSTVCPLVITSLPKLLLEYNSGEEIVGIFSTLSAPTIIIPTLATSIFAPFLTYFSNICKNKDFKKLKNRFTLFLSLLCIAGLIIFLISTLLAEPIFNMIYGDDILPFVEYFNLLIVGIFIYSAGIYAITVLITKNQGIYAGISSTIAMILSSIVFIALLPCTGVSEASWGLIISYGLFAILNILCVYLIPLSNKKEVAAI